MTSFNDIMRGGEARLTRSPVAKDATVGDVHVSSAIGNSEAAQLPFPRMPHPRLDSHGVPEDDADKKRKKKRPRPHAFIGYSQSARARVMPEERGPATNAEDGPSGVTVKRSPGDYDYVAASVMRYHDRPTVKRYSSTKDLPDAVRGKLKGKKRRQWMHVFNSSLGTHGDESRAFAEAWSTVKKSRSDTLSGEPMVGVGGRRLEPFDEGTFFVPMRYDPSALSYLRPDQIPHLLDALTHPDQLPKRSLPIKDLVAVKGRVRRDTVQKHLDKMAEKRGTIGYSQSGVDVHLEGVDDLSPPVALCMNKTFYLVDGHDRTVAMWLDGLDVVDVVFDNLDDYDNTKPDPDIDHKNTAYALLQGVDGRTLTNYVDGTLSVPFMMDAAFFNHLRPDQVPKFTYAVTHPDKLADATVPLASLVAIQNRVNANTVADKVEKPSKKRPIIVRMNDVNYIADGHDRLTAMWLRGVNEVPVKLTDITWADNTMRPADLVKSTMEDRARAQERLEAAEGLVKSISVQVDDVNRQLVEKQAEADRLRAEADRYEVEKRAAVERFEAEKRAEVEKFEAERLAATTEKVAEVEHGLKVKKLKVARKLEAADDYVVGMERQQKKLDRYVADQQESIDRQVAKILREAEEKREEAARQAAEVLKDADRKNREADRRLAEAQGGITEVLKEAERKEREADRRLAKAREEAEQAASDVVKELARKNHDVDLKLQEADRYVEYVAKAKRKAKRKLEKTVETADAYSERTRGDADRYFAEKRLEADRYDVEKRAAADQYDVNARSEADRYAVEKRMSADEREFGRRAELSKFELEQVDEIRKRTTTELSARQIAQIQVLKKQLRTGKRQLKVDIRKADEEKRQIFGWASVVTKNGEPVVDKQGDIIPVDELEPAVYEYMLRSRDGGNMHVTKGVSRCIESMMWTTEKAAAMGVPLPDGIEGWWVGYQVDCPDFWESIKSGDIAEFSIGGQAVSTKLED